MKKIAEQTGTVTEKNPENGTGKLSKIDRALNIFNMITPLTDSIERVVEIKEKYQVMLYEPEFLFKYRKDFVVFLIAFRLYNDYRLSKPIKLGEVKNNIEKIRLHDIELAENIERLFPLVEKGTRIFSDLLDALRNGKEYFVSYISTHLTELIAKAKSINDEKLSKQFVILFSSISGHAVEYLIRYRNDCDNWPNYAVANSIDFFIRRVNLFLKGGLDNNIQFMGLYKDFGDVELTQKILSDNTVRNLWRYIEQIRYINTLIGLCKESEVSGKWEGFFGNDGFWGREGDAKGKNFDNYADEFEKKYGNSDFAEYLKLQKLQIGENPEAWGGEWKDNVLVKDGVLPQLLRKLQHPSYQRQKIIFPASLALHRILKEREDELKAKRDKFVDELIKLLQEAEGIGIAREKLIKKVSRLLKKKKIVLLKELNKDMAEFVSKIKLQFVDYATLSEEQDKILDKMTAYYIGDITGRLVDAAKKQLAYEQQQLSTGQFLRKGDIRGLAFIDVADKLAKDLKAKKLQYERFEHVSDEDFAYLQNSISKLRGIVKEIGGIYDYTRFKLGQRYIIKFEDLEVLQFDYNRIKNIHFEFGYVKKMLDRLI